MSVMVSLFIFRRDLRLYDNTGLIKALEESDEVIPCFILDDRQIEKNEYFSRNAFEFMVASLHCLDKELRERNSKLYLFKGIAHEVIQSLIKELGINAVYVNEDYTPFSKKRDALIRQACVKSGVRFCSEFDLLLTKPGEVLTLNKTPYTVFTQFYKTASKLEVFKPKNAKGRFFNGRISNESSLPKSARLGGREEGLKILKKLDNFQNYDFERNFPFKESTKLSPHNKFGTLSIREVYHKVQNTLPFSTIINELYWRDFFSHIIHFFPHVLGNAFRRQYNNIVWENDEKKFDAWKEGKTGFPIVDAGMRELNETGFMHNRVRMITASFLIKDLHIGWKLGEKYFANQLVDYDPALNNGNWQWAASTGCDSQPYFRIFNPWLQQKKYDPDCIYIKKWLPELKNMNAKEIHMLEFGPADNYPRQIVRHEEEKKKALEMYKSAVERKVS